MIRRLLGCTTLFMVIGALSACENSQVARTAGYTESNVKYEVGGDRSLLDLCGSYDVDKSDPRTGVAVGWWRDDANKDVLQTALIVESVDAEGNARVLYSHGQYRPWGIDYSECEIVKGKFVDEDSLKVYFRDENVGTFEFHGDAVIASYSSQDGLTRGDFEMIE